MGHLQVRFSGTRDAAAIFQLEVRAVTEQSRYTQTAYSPSLYHQAAKRLKMLVHGNVSSTVGSLKQAGWLRRKMEERFEIKTKVIGKATGEGPVTLQPV